MGRSGRGQLGREIMMLVMVEKPDEIYYFINIFHEGGGSSIEVTIHRE